MTERNEKDISAAAVLAAEGAIIFHNGFYAEALTIFEKAISLEPDNARAHTGRSLTLAQLGDPGEGLRAAEDAVRADPRHAPAYTALAFCHHRLGREEEARAAFEQALALEPDEPRVLYNYACYWAELANEEKCRAYLARAFPVVADHTLDHARNDPDLARYVDTTWFRELLADAKRRRRRARGEGTPAREG